jgi:enterochelin esterase-like enzyme
MKPLNRHYTALTLAMGVLLTLASACTMLPVLQPSAPATSTPAEKLERFPTPTATPTPAGCTETSGRIERRAIPSKLLSSTLWISVYTPPCYSPTPAELYPVLYLLHGQGMNDSYWSGLGAGEIADEAILAGQKPFLMVMPYEERNYDAPSDSKFPDAVMKELLPWVEANYPVCAERECRAIGGISRGGGWAVHIALRNFETFGAVGAHSMGLMPNDRWYVSHLLETYTVADFPRFYVDRGEDDFLAGDIDLFENTLTTNGILHEYHVSPGRHEGAYWQAHVAEYMQWYMQGWQ